MSENQTQVIEQEETVVSVPSTKSNNWFRTSKVPVKALNGLIIVGMAAIVICTIFLAKNGGFTITFETDGGSMVQSVKVEYGELIPEPETPVKEGFVFDGWYWDFERENDPCDFKADTVADNETLYAKWQKN